ncbi:hypothetical protein [Variovorax sp. YR216]|uniref:hypothetical protein n=1 Tax=Variovorax sp. YR216 TaxID=1882828 RepID=UPI00089D64EA|nr:hypothetical protein [Variovorax sp. YR216]SEB23626.1 hypothetical protein SAMN05444680_11882 [Variovorax sp. YR216]
MEQSQTVSASTFAAGGPDGNALGGALYFPFSAVAAPSAPPPATTTDEGSGYTTCFGTVGLVILGIVAWKMLSR